MFNCSSGIRPKIAQGIKWFKGFQFVQGFKSFKGSSVQCPNDSNGTIGSTVKMVKNNNNYVTRSGATTF